ncbi:MAG: hypothetical protein A3J62_01780 [Candidatus Buchananbacteria bacterium RIFCSPHIGHO2_02_FULL_38_8]|uniref:Large ribosomal subunit protein uL4 n=2 Tax=Candidatus Buchananiibacteriota TaxID=1817903 RepID=A0A1G1XZL1_9BACT|nr:MAG: hypothetical protein A2731_01365 [Candidatus Buchananbacteria bacterium RIFCSPHIGHO2_01_FULL_39_8]OGY47320.1 MAG: hypothetical protein A3J62_01780 [Candidatus Buchananbacteria bacterium RIFCSPHIGHO2_02_FULL_38_8]
MDKVKVYNQEGKEVGEQVLNPDIFSVKIKPQVVQQVVVAMQANSRQVLAHTKDRSEVSGGGRKPWRQKGTGRARHGSIRSPLWRGGGVTFGPTNQRNFSLKINKKVKRKALFMGLADKANNQKIVLLDNLGLPAIKTKTFFKILEDLKLRSKKEKFTKSKKEVDLKTKEEHVKTKNRKKEPTVLLVIPQKDEKVVKSARNISRLDILNASSLNILDVLRHQYVLMPLKALKTIEDTFLKK